MIPVLPEEVAWIAYLLLPVFAIATIAGVWRSLSSFPEPVLWYRYGDRQGTLSALSQRVQHRAGRSTLELDAERLNRTIDAEPLQ